VLSGAGVGHSAPYYAQSAPGRATPGSPGFGLGRPRPPRLGRPTRREDGAHPLGPLSPGPHGAPGDGNGGPVAVAWPAQHIDGTGPGGGDQGDPPAPRMPRTDDGLGDGGGR